MFLPCPLLWPYPPVCLEKAFSEVHIHDPAQNSVAIPQGSLLGASRRQPGSQVISSAYSDAGWSCFGVAEQVLE